MLSLKDRALIARHLAVMIRSGLTVTEALGVAARSSRRAGPILRSVEASVAGGRKLSEAMADFPDVFPPVLTSAARAGEASGTLTDNLANIARELEKESVLAGKLRSAMIYPLTILILMIVLGVALSILILPKLLPLFSGLRIELPWTTRLLIWLSSITEGANWLWLLALAALVAGLWWLARSPRLTPALHWLWLHLPLTRQLTREVNLGRFCRRFGLLLQSGLSADEALGLAGASSSNHYYRLAAKVARNNLLAGGKISASLATSPALFPDLMVKMLEVGETSGQLKETFFYLADFYEHEADRAVKNLPTVIEPILLFVIGLVVALFALAIITPIYELTGNANR